MQAANGEGQGLTPGEGWGGGLRDDGAGPELHVRRGDSDDNVALGPR